MGPQRRQPSACGPPRPSGFHIFSARSPKNPGWEKRRKLAGKPGKLKPTPHWGSVGVSRTGFRKRTNFNGKHQNLVARAGCGHLCGGRRASALDARDSGPPSPPPLGRRRSLDARPAAGPRHGLAGFLRLVAENGAAVVNISVTEKARRRRRGEGEGDDPLSQFFHHYQMPTPSTRRPAMASGRDSSSVPMATCSPMRTWWRMPPR
jgi:hypothetical protein